MAKKSRKNVDIHSPSVVKTVFIVSSLAILAFLVLIVKTTSFNSEPQAAPINCGQVKLSKCNTIKNCKLIGTVKSGYCAKRPTPTLTKSSNKAPGLASNTKVNTYNKKPQELLAMCQVKIGFPSEGIYVAESTPSCGSRISAGTIYYDFKYAQCCITPNDFKLKGDSFCGSMVVYDEKGTNLGFAAKKCKIGVGKCNQVSDTDLNNTYSRGTYKNKTKTYSECYTTVSASTTKYKGTCCMKP